MKSILKRWILILTALCMALSLCGCVQEEYAPVSENSQGLTVHFIDVGQADAALVTCDGESMLIDGGNADDSSRIATYLKKQGIEHLDYVVNTHAHEDHVGGISGALNVCTVGEVLASCYTYDSKVYDNFVRYAEKSGAPLTVPEVGDEFYLSDAKVTVLGPVCEYEEENDNSIVLRISYGKTSFLFTGDMEQTAEKDVLNSRANISADVLKVAHHGSSSSSSYAFLREVMPEYAVISAGRGNSYGHPHEEVLSRLRDAGVKLYRTDLQGDIVARSDGENVTFETSKGGEAQVNPTVEDKEEIYIGNKKSKKFHRSSCESLPSDKNAVEFKDRDSAYDAGYSPCGNCKP